MDASVYETIVRKVARAICAATNIAKPGQNDVILDAPDDLSWDATVSPPRPVPRWILYEERGRAAVDAMNISKIAEMAAFIVRQVDKGKNATAPQIVDHAFQDIEKLARGILDQVQPG